MRPGKVRPQRNRPGRSASTRGRAARAASDLQRARALVVLRAEGMCEAGTSACPPRRHLGDQAHHVTMRSQGGEDHVNNLIWVCHLAHDYIHRNPAVSYERGWLRHSWEA